MSSRGGGGWTRRRGGTSIEPAGQVLNTVEASRRAILRTLSTAETVETTELDRIKSTNAKPPHYQ